MANIEYVPLVLTPDAGSDKVDGYEVVSASREPTLSEPPEKTPIVTDVDEMEKAADDLAAVHLSPSDSPIPEVRAVTVVIVRTGRGHGKYGNHTVNDKRGKHQEHKERKDKKKGRECKDKGNEKHARKRGGSPPPWEGLKHGHGRHGRHGRHGHHGHPCSPPPPGPPPPPPHGAMPSPPPPPPGFNGPAPPLPFMPPFAGRGGFGGRGRGGFHGHGRGGFGGGGYGGRTIAHHDHYAHRGHHGHGSHRHNKYEVIDVELPTGVDPADVDWDATLAELRREKREAEREGKHRKAREPVDSSSSSSNSSDSDASSLSSSSSDSESDSDSSSSSPDSDEPRRRRHGCGRRDRKRRSDPEFQREWPFGRGFRGFGASFPFSGTEGSDMPNHGLSHADFGAGPRHAAFGGFAFGGPFGHGPFGRHGGPHGPHSPHRGHGGPFAPDMFASNFPFRGPPDGKRKHKHGRHGRKGKHSEYPGMPTGCPAPCGHGHGHCRAPLSCTPAMHSCH